MQHSVHAPYTVSRSPPFPLPPAESCTTPTPRTPFSPLPQNTHTHCCANSNTYHRRNEHDKKEHDKKVSFVGPTTFSLFSVAHLACFCNQPLFLRTSQKPSRSSNEIGADPGERSYSKSSKRERARSYSKSSKRERARSSSKSSKRASDGGEVSERERDDEWRRKWSARLQCMWRSCNAAMSEM